LKKEKEAASQANLPGEAGTAEVEQAKLEKERELKLAQDKIAGLEKTLAEKEGEISALKQAAEISAEEKKRIEDTLAQAVLSYRSLVIQANPQIPAELLSGDSVEAIDSALARAKELVSKVKQGLEAESLKIRIPAGAPARMPPDTGALSAREKIQYAIGGNR